MASLQSKRWLISEEDKGAGAIAREHLLTGACVGSVDRVEAHRIRLRPGQRAFRHTHPGGVIGYVVDGEILLQIEGQPAMTLAGGGVFYEPPGATIARFDNASDATDAMFIAFYTLAGDQALISPVEL